MVPVAQNENMKIHSFILLCLIGMLCLPGCKRKPYQPIYPFPTEYTSAYQEIHGRCYDSIPFAVVSLDLYSEGLELDDDHRMNGSGYNLYISDIFVPDSLLTAGNYCADTSAKAFTFLPGRNFDGTPFGIYLLRIEEGKLIAIQLLDSGRFVVRDTTNNLIDLHFTLYYQNSYNYTTTYETHFQGLLMLWQNN